jgi:uncharacterized tellurite resistance protein B-like protein
MPVVVFIVGTLALWVAYYFVRYGGLDHLREKSAQRRDAARRGQARESERTAPLRAIDDPRDAATVLMLLITRGGDPTPSQISAIEATMRRVFGFDHDARERLTHARFIASCAQSFEEAAGLFSDLFRKQLNAEERRQLVGMVEDIARIDGPSPTQTGNLDVLKRKKSVATA